MQSSEEWRPVSWNPHYEVSSFGRVRSSYTNKILNPWQRNRHGKYLAISISKKTVALHRLVAETFIPNPNNYPEVNHKDEDPTNNRIDNLEWCTRKYNITYGTRLARMSEIAKHQKSCIPIVGYKDGKLMYEFSSSGEAGRNGFDQQNVNACCRGKLKTHKGIEWRYKDGDVRPPKQGDREAKSL